MWYAYCPTTLQPSDWHLCPLSNLSPRLPCVSPGPRLFKQASAKSNRSILLNAVEYCVFPGAVNREAKQRVLEEIARVEARHFLILFRDARCQFRALYWCVAPRWRGGGEGRGVYTGKGEGC